MKPTTIIMLIVAVILLSAAIYLIIEAIKPVPKEKTLEYDPAIEVNVLSSSTIEALESCQGSSLATTLEEEAKYQFCAYDITEENLTKMKILRTIRGNKLCGYDQRNQNNNCSFEDHYGNNSRDIWRLTWYTIVIKRNTESIKVWANNEDYFYMRSGNSAPGTPFSGSIYLLNPEDKAAIERLKE